MLDIELVKVVHKENEQLVFRVLTDCNLWPYLIFDVLYDDNGVVSNSLRHSFVFPNYNVNSGDYIVLRTNRGQNESFTNRVKTKTHIFYWGFDDGTVLWRGGNKALIVKASEYKYIGL